MTTGALLFLDTLVSYPYDTRVSAGITIVEIRWHQCNFPLKEWCTILLHKCRILFKKKCLKKKWE